MYRRTIFIAVYLLMASASAAPQAYCDSDKPDPIDIKLEHELNNSGGVTVAIREAQGRAYEAWDKRLNAAYRELQSKVSDPDRKLLTEAQREWLKYRDMHLRFVRSQSMLGQEGTLGPVVVGDWSRDLLRQRVCDLERAVQYLKAN